MKKKSDSKIEIQQRIEKVRAYLAGLGLPVSQTQAYEVAARMLGLENKHSLAAAIPKLTSADLCLLKKPDPCGTAPAPRLADMPGYPDSVAVQTGETRVFYQVDWYDREALRLLHNPEALMTYLTENMKGYPDGTNSCALQLVGEAGRLEFSFRQMLDLRYRKVNGIGYWCLADGSTKLTFICGTTWSPEEGSQKEVLTTPQKVQSVKAVKILQLPSIEGEGYHKYFLVPPHVDIEVAKKRLDDEALRLKQEEGNGLDDGNYPRYQGWDIAAFAKDLGLEQVQPLTCSEHWDC